MAGIVMTNAENDVLPHGLSQNCTIGSYERFICLSCFQCQRHVRHRHSDGNSDWTFKLEFSEDMDTKSCLMNIDNIIKSL